MAFQMVYTSVRSGLVAGRSGFCTAARHKELKESLVARLEDFSAQYDRGLAGGAGEAPLPVIYQHRIITIREDRYHVLMRLGDAGNDYSGRTNHIAHSLVLEPAEVEGLRLNPAEVILGLSQRGFWRTRYDDPARYFGNDESVDLTTLSPAAALPADRWARRTGSPANAAQLFDSDRPTDAGVVISGCGEADGQELLGLFAESLLLLGPDRTDPERLWSVPFTTIFQSPAEKSHFRWCGILKSSALLQQEARGGRKILTLGSALSPPSGIFADLAQGLKPKATSLNSEPDELPVYRSIPLPGESSPQALAAIETSGPVASVGQARVVVDEVFIPLSIENPARAKRTEKKRNGRSLALVTGIAILLVCLVATGWWSMGRDVRAAEEKVKEMVDKGQWEEVRKCFTGKETTENLKDKSKNLANWNAAANAIVSFNEIKFDPGKFKDNESVNAAMQKIAGEWTKNNKTPGDDIKGPVNKAKADASESAAAWLKSVKSLTTAWETAAQRFEQAEIADGEKLSEQISEIQGTLNNLKEHTPDSAKHLNELFQILIEKVNPAINALSEITTDEVSLESARAKAKGELAKLSETKKSIYELDEALSGKSPHLYNKATTTNVQLSEKFKTLLEPGVLERKKAVKQSIPIALPEPNLTPIQTGNTQPQEKVSIPRTYIVRRTTKDEVDLSGVKEIAAKFPGSFSILPLSAIGEPELNTESILRKEVNVLNEDTIYFTQIRLLSGVKERKLKFERGNENSKKFWADFPGGFVLRFPKTEASVPEFQIAVIEAPASTDGNTSNPMGEPLIALSVSKFLKRSDKGEVSLTKDARATAEHFVFPEDSEPYFELILSGVYPSSSTAISAADLSISPIPDIEKDVSRIEKNIKQINSNISAAANFERDYGQLGQKLFPEFFLQDGIRALTISPPPISSKGKDFGIVKLGQKTDRPWSRLRNPIIKTFQEFRVLEKPRVSEKPLFQDFQEYVEALFKSLDELADGSSGLNKANDRIQRFIERSSDLKETNGVNRFQYGWIELEKVSRSEKWSTPKGVDPTPKKFTSELEAKDALKEYVAEQYFSDFFEAWEDLFTTEKAKEIFDYLSKNNGQQSLADPKTEQSRIDQLNALKSKFTNTDLSDDGVYSLNVVYEFKNPNSPTPIRQVIPLIGSAPAAN